MLRVSTRYKELILGPNSFESIFNGGRILVFSGAQPASADYAEQGTLLAQVTVDGQPWAPNGAGGAGLQFERSGAYAVKTAADDWRLKVDVSGVAGWFRLVGRSIDDGNLSYSAPRIDGAVGTGGTELVLPTTALTIGQSIPVQQWTFTIPPIGT